MTDFGAYSITRERRITMNELRFNDTKSENHSDDSDERKWNLINWQKAEEYIYRLQYLITNSFYAKALAVRKVTSNKAHIGLISNHHLKWWS